MTVTEGLKAISMLAMLAVATGGLHRLEQSSFFDATGESFKADPTLAPSGRALDLSSLDPARAYISIAVDDAVLNDPTTGLLTYSQGRGRLWERPAVVSFIDVGGRTVWATRAGLRRNGGASRRQGRPSWRLIFRDVYGSDARREPALPALAVAPQTLIVRREPGWHPNIFAMAVAQRNGALAPEIRPVGLFVNGEYQGNYLLSEHVNRGGWGRSRFGDEDMFMFVYRGGRSNDARSSRAYGDLRTWIRTAPAPLDMEAVGARVDLDNLLRHLFTFMFCATTDWAQGAAVRQGTGIEPRWFWVHWDLDQSFLNARRSRVDGPGLGTVVNPGRPNEGVDVRAMLFNRLRAEDPKFGRHFTALVTELLNHRLGTAFFEQLVEQSGHLLRREYAAELQEYFERRPSVIRAELDEYLDAGPSYRVSIQAPTSMPLDVDGFAESSGYQGWYFTGTPVSVDLADGSERFSHWLVNGVRRDGRPLVATVSKPTSIRAVMR